MSGSNGAELGEILGTINLTCRELATEGRTDRERQLSEEFREQLMSLVLDVGVSCPDTLHFKIDDLKKEVTAVWLKIR